MQTPANPAPETCQRDSGHNPRSNPLGISFPCHLIQAQCRSGAHSPILMTTILQPCLGPALTHLPFPPPPLQVKFSVQRRAGLGDSWKIVGPAAELGRWAPDVAPRMSWNEGDVWTTVVALPPGEQEFKAALRAMDGTITWEAGPDRTVVVPPSGEVEVKLEVRMPWEVTAQQEEAVKRCNDVTVVAMEEVKEEVAAYVAA